MFRAHWASSASGKVSSIAVRLCLKRRAELRLRNDTGACFLVSVYNVHARTRTHSHTRAYTHTRAHIHITLFLNFMKTITVALLSPFYILGRRTEICKAHPLTAAQISLPFPSQNCHGDQWFWSRNCFLSPRVAPRDGRFP